MEMMESTRRFQRLLELDSGKGRGNPDSPHAIQMHKIRRKHLVRKPAPIENKAEATSEIQDIPGFLDTSYWTRYSVRWSYCISNQ